MIKVIEVVTTIPTKRFKRFGVSFPPEWEVSYLEYPIPDEILINACQGADFLLVSSTHAVSKKVIENTPSLRLLHVDGVGYDMANVETAKEVGLPVCNNHSSNSTSAAEHTIAFMLTGLKRLCLVDKQLKTRDYQEVEREYLAKGVRELSSQHVGLIGLGAIGQEVARLLQPFGCKISYYDMFRQPPELELKLKVLYVSLEELLQECDIISLHVPALPDTRDLINQKNISLMKPDALLINTSRGEIIDQLALAEALEEGRINGAAVDTIVPEPPGENHPLFTLSEKASNRIIITPHVAGKSDEAFKRMLNWAIANMKRVVNGEKPVNIVNEIEEARPANN